MIPGGLLKKDNLEAIYDKLPEAIKAKIQSGRDLTPIERTQEIGIAKRELGINIRPTADSLDALNEYYRQSNPLAKQ